MDAGFGGPVWHASICHHGARVAPLDLIAARAHRALQGVGDPTRGEWTEPGSVGVVHVRRRLTAAEWGGQPWGFDLRKTAAGDQRLMAAGCPRPANSEEYTDD